MLASMMDARFFACSKSSSTFNGSNVPSAMSESMRRTSPPSARMASSKSLPCFGLMRMHGVLPLPSRLGICDHWANRLTNAMDLPVPVSPMMTKNGL